MFTIKFYTNDNARQIIRSAESFTILRDEDKGEYEITMHQKNQNEDSRIDILPVGTPRDPMWPPVFQKAIIENGAGRTTEIIHAGPSLPVAKAA